MYTQRTYPWPASKLRSEDMHALYLSAQSTGKPITQLLLDAVTARFGTSENNSNIIEFPVFNAEDKEAA